jgi:polar amino acid transport system substrate-binding protein
VTSGSSSETYAEKETEAVVVPVTARPDCLEALQENRVDAVLLPYSILAGLAYQDSTTKILEPRLKAQSYGIAISKDNPELVQFVNALLERWRTDHTLEDLQQQSLPLRLQTTPVAPDPVYLEPDERLD